MHDIAREVEKLADDLGIDRKRSIGEVAKELKVETHIIRFWEEKFPQIKPEIGAGKRRYYYNKQVKVLKKIKKFLYEDGYTIAGLQKLLKKRKHDNHKGEDLDMILDYDLSAEEILLMRPSESDREFELGDFIDPKVAVIEVQEELEIGERKKIEQVLNEAKSNLQKLKSLLAY